MYCSKITVELAVSKGYKQCTCNAGGYPDCICDNSVYNNVRLDDVQRWLYTKEFHIMVTNDYNGYDFQAIKLFQWEVDRFDIKYAVDSAYVTFTSPDYALEAGIIHALNLI